MSKNKYKPMRSERQPSSYLTGDYENDPAQLLAAEIVIHAIVDWRNLIRRKAWRNATPCANNNFDELRVFFKSGWCDFLMQGFEIAPERVLATLEAELEAAKRKDGKKDGK